MKMTHHYSVSVASVAAAVLVVLGCERPRDAARPAERTASSLVTTPAHTEPSAFRIPADSEIPAGPIGASVRRGRAILAATSDSVPGHVGSNLRCTSCHLDNGTRPNAAPLVGVYARFPQFRARTGTVGVIEERVNDCFERSLNGKAIAWNSSEMRDILAYLSFLSRGIAAPATVKGQGLPKLTPLPGDSARGETIYAASCARCHGAMGEGQAGPALWGSHSFNIAASMARVGAAAGFIRYNMPYDQPGTLTDQQAFDVATYINRHTRPDFRGKENDWPKGDAPADVPYRMKAHADTSTGR